MYASGVFVPVILGLFWNRGTRQGAIVAIIAGAVVGTAGATGLVTYPVPAIIVGGLVSLIAFIAVSLSTKRPTKEELQMVQPQPVQSDIHS